MADFEYSVVTNAGRELIAQSVNNGHKIAFTRIKSGSGTYSAAEKTPAALRSMSALKTEQQSTGIATQSRDGEKIKLGTNISNTGLTSGYFFTELGIFAKDNDDPQASEVLYAIAVTDNPSYMPEEDLEAPTVLVLEYNTVITNDVDYVVVISSSIYATATDLADGLAAKVDKVTGYGLSQNDFTNSLKDKLDRIPTLGTAAEKDVAQSGNASANQVVTGNDTRLSDSRTPNNDANLVHKTGTETISGIKTFNDDIVKYFEDGPNKTTLSITRDEIARYFTDGIQSTEMHIKHDEILFTGNLYGLKIYSVYNLKLGLQHSGSGVDCLIINPDGDVEIAKNLRVNQNIQADGDIDVSGEINGFRFYMGQDGKIYGEW